MNIETHWYFSDEMRFLLLESYAAHHHTTSDTVLHQWDALGISDLIFKMYWRYHSEAIENAFDDIDPIIASKQATPTQA